jgi:23S rRNA (adenine2503-C2)-methyltransferase
MRKRRRISRDIPSLADVTVEELASCFSQWGIPASHACRLLRDYYENAGQVSPDLEIPKSLRARLGADLPLFSSSVARCAASEDGTRKLLISLADGAKVESVLMPDIRDDRAAGCLSTQVGCAMACDFCATGMQGFTRNLSPGEIVEQFLHLKRVALDMGRRLHTIVLMGMGEPLLNLENVIKAIRLIADPRTGQLGWRQVTLSTVGLQSQLRQFVETKLNIQLAISLHAPDDQLRAKLIPIARAHPISPILDLAQEHQANTGRVSIIQYCLLGGVNDSDEQAHALGRLLEGRRMHLNLLSYNATGRPFAPSAPDRISRFLDIVREHRIVAHLRKSRGQDIAAACGQLRQAQSRP